MPRLRPPSPPCALALFGPRTFKKPSMMDVGLLLLFVAAGWSCAESKENEVGDVIRR